jgi:hypothetical protein
MYSRFMLFLLTILVTSLSFSQNSTGSITGTIIDSETKEPLVGANILVEGTRNGTSSNLDGYFNLDLTKGIHTIRFSFIGYDNQRQVFQISKDKRKYDLRILLQAKAILEDQVTVTGEKIAPTTVVQNIEAKEIQSMPNLHNDAMRSVKVLAGVASNNELSSGYNVRGGSFDENLIYINGFEIYRPFLLRQGVEENQTLLNQDLISGMKFYNGAFPVSYGDRMSSALDVEYLKKNTNNFSGSVRADAFNVGASIKTGNETYKLGVGFRYAYPQLFSGSLQTQGDYEPSFSDFQLSTTYNFTDNTSIELLGVYANNQFALRPDNWIGNYGGFVRGDYRELEIDYDGENSFEYKTALLGLRLKHYFSDNLKWTLSISDYYTTETENRNTSGRIINNGSAYTDEDDGDYQKTRFEFADNAITLNSLRLRNEFNYKFTNHSISFGTEYRFVGLDNSVNERLYETGENTLLQVPIDKRFSESTKLNNFSAFIQNDINIAEGFTANIGLRYLRYEYTNENLLSPRLNLTFIESPVNIFTFSWGYYHQAPFINELRNPDLRKIKSQQSIHYVFGWERVLNPTLKLTSEIYYKDLDNLIPYYFDELKMVYLNGNTREGFSYGLDIQLDGELVKGMRSIIGYSYLDSRERDKGTTKYQRRLADQTHTINVFLQDKMPKHPNWQAHMRFLLGSGFLFYNRSTYRDLNTGNTVIDVDINNPEEYFLFFRVDLGLSAAFDVTESSKITAVAEVLNVFNQLNYSSYDWIQVFEEYNSPIRIPRVLSSRFFNFRVEYRF